MLSLFLLSAGLVAELLDLGVNKLNKNKWL